MKNFSAHVLAVLTLALPFAAHAQDSQDVVRGYFAALERKDFNGALALTSGSAQTSTQHMVGTLEKQAAEHHADVELKVQKLEVGQPSKSACQRMQVVFDIDVIGKKWFFKKVARKLSGTAQFQLAAAGDRIVAIDGILE